jgi:citronellol/citronellal dehydrogenase
VLTAGIDRFNGRFLIDEEVLRGAGVTDFAHYAVDPSQEPLLDLFLDEDADNSGFGR